MLTELWALDLVAWGTPLETEAKFVMSGQEHRRQATFRNEGARRQYLGARLLARTILGSRLKVPPASLDFEADANGKPRLYPDQPLHFNLSHSGSLVVCALSAAGPVGIDVETWDRRASLMDIAQAHFSPDEASWIRRAESHATVRFLALWTLKEACLKQTGQGIAGGMDHLGFRAGLGGRMEPTLLGLPTCRLLKPSSRYWLAACAPGMDRVVPRLQWLEHGTRT